MGIKSTDEIIQTSNYTKKKKKKRPNDYRIRLAKRRGEKMKVKIPNKL